MSRGCGGRVFAGVYAEFPTDPRGTMAIENFLVDPPVPVSMEESGWHRRGVNMVDRGGITHLVDWIGSQFYTNAADFIEEARRLGVSRRLSRKTDFRRLTPGSRLLLVHERAYLNNHADFYDVTSHACPKSLARHGLDKPEEMCVGLYWECVEGIYIANPRDRDGVRMFPPTEGEWSYVARRAPQGFTPTFREAIFMSVPITKLTVIIDPLASQHDESLAVAQESGLPVTLEDG